MECISPIFVRKTRLFVPCGRCGNCVRRRISDYSIRCCVELRHSHSAYFITLTYERDPLQLYRKDLQRFFKRCRKVGWKFKYFAVGDYGDTFGRPHFHVLLFAKAAIDTGFVWSLWISGRDQVRKRGFVQVEPLEEGGVAYVVQYGYLAKLDWPVEDKRQAPFFLMSKRPAIGADYLDEVAVAWHRRRLQNSFFADGCFKKALPRYYKDKLFPSRLKLWRDGKYGFEEAKAHEDRRSYGLMVSDRRRDEYIRKLTNGTRDGYVEYYGRLVEASDQYLSMLRERKNDKNKLRVLL